MILFTFNIVIKGIKYLYVHKFIQKKIKYKCTKNLNQFQKKNLTQSIQLSELLQNAISYSKKTKKKLDFDFTNVECCEKRK